jgi:hypothetical protein
MKADKTEWGASAATAVLAEQADRAQQLAAQAEREQTFRDLLARDGVSWRDRLAAALGAACASFDAAVGYPALVVTQSESGHVSARSADDGSYVAFVADFAPDFQGRGAALIVRTRLYGRDSSLPYRFEPGDSGLVVNIAGEHLGPEATARRITEPWLRSLSLRGR